MSEIGEAGERVGAEVGARLISGILEDDNAFAEAIVDDTGHADPLDGQPDSSLQSSASPGRPRDPATGRFTKDPDATPSDKPTFTDADRRAEWKRLASDPDAPLTPRQRAEIITRGYRGPQRDNPFTLERETMELSHEPVPLSEGGTRVVPRWPDDHAAIDPNRYLKGNRTPGQPLP